MPGAYINTMLPHSFFESSFEIVSSLAIAIKGKTRICLALLPQPKLNCSEFMLHVCTFCVIF